MKVGTQVLPPAQFDRSASLRSAPPALSLPGNALQAPPASGSPTEKLETLQIRVQDTLQLGGSLPETASRSIGQLNEALQSLKQLTGSGSNASALNILQRFQSETLPQNITALKANQSELQQQIAALPAAAPERQALELQLQVVGSSLDIYQQAAGLLAQSPLLQPLATETGAPTVQAAGPITASPTATAPPVVNQTQAPSATAAVAEVAPAGLPELDLPALLGDGVIPASARRDTGSLDAYYDHPHSSQTIFNQREREINANIQTLDTQIQSLTQQGGHEAEIAKLQKAKTLLQDLSTLYGQVSGLNHSGKGVEADVQKLSAQIQKASASLKEIAPELDTATFDNLQKQLSDLNTISTVFLQLPQPKPSSNLGEFINTTYKRLGQIESGQRHRANEPRTIAGALKSFSNDASDLVVFVQRFGDLKDQIRSGKLTPEQARELALKGIPGTSNAFRGAYLSLVNSEVALQEARELNIKAQQAIASGNASVGQANGEIATDNAATASGRAANTAANAAAGRQDYPAATAQNQTARADQAKGATQLTAAGGHLAQADSSRAEADGLLRSARGLEAQASHGASAVLGGPFGKELRDPAHGVQSHAAEVRTELAATDTDLSRLGSSIATSRSELATATQANQGLATAIVGTDQTIARGQEALRRQEAQNKSELDRLSGILGSSTGKFEIELTAGISIGKKLSDNFGVEGTASVIIGLTGEKELDGAYVLNVKIGGEASAEVKAFLFNVEGSVRFEASAGIRLKSPAQVKEFSRLLNNVTLSLGRNGINSPEAAAARQDLLNYLALTSRTSTAISGAAAVTEGPEGSQRGAAGKVTYERITEHNFEDLNNDGVRNANERLTTEELTSLTVKGSTFDRNHVFGVSGQVVKFEDGRIKSVQVGIGLPSGDLPEHFLEGARSVLTSKGIPAKSLPGPEAEARIRSHLPKLEAGQRATFNVLQGEDGKFKYSISITSEVEYKAEAEIPVSAVATAKLGARVTGEYSTVIPLN